MYKTQKEQLLKYYVVGYDITNVKYHPFIQAIQENSPQGLFFLAYYVCRLESDFKLMFISIYLDIGSDMMNFLLGVSLTEYLETADPTSNPPECVTKYAQYLKSKYLQMCTFQSEWPPKESSDKSYTELALVNDTISFKSGPVSSSMEYDYVRDKIDSIVAAKKTIQLHEVFYPIINIETKESRLTILMDGAPGVGKTTITRKLCIEWARGSLLQEYH